MTARFVPNAYASLKRVLVHRPGPELEKVTERTLREFNFERPVDRGRFVGEYDAMLRLSRTTASRRCSCARSWRRTRTRSATSTSVPT